MADTQTAKKPREQSADIAKLTAMLKVCLWLSAGVAAALAVFAVMQLQSMDALQQARFASDDAASRAVATYDFGVMIVGLLQLVLFVGVAVLFLRWIYRANDNARRLGAEGMRFTPGWSVGWYFIPIASLWKPYQAMKELWLASRNPRDWQNQTRGAVLPWWWLFWLLGTIVVFNASQPTAAAVDVAHQIVWVVLDLIAIRLIGQIAAFQVAAAQATPTTA